MSTLSNGHDDHTINDRPTINGHPTTNGSSSNETRQIKTIIIGCGLGSLSLAIQLLLHNQPVLLLEKNPSLSEIGAGIQVPPNATRIMSSYNLLDKLYAAGMTVRGGPKICRWADGSVIGQSFGGRTDTSQARGNWCVEKFGYSAHQIHRADYQIVLVEEVRRLGGEIRLDCEVETVESCEARPVVVLKSGERLEGYDIVVGGDGLHSKVRTAGLGRVQEARESGDLAYRMTIPMERLEEGKDEFGWEILSGREAVYFGPGGHTVIYPVRGGTIINIVMLLRRLKRGGGVVGLVLERLGSFELILYTS